MRAFFHYKNVITLIPVFILIVTVILRLFEPSIIQRERLIIFDIYQLLHPRDYQALPVKIIDIDDESLKRIEQWPWSRTIISRLITNLSNAGATVIGFDMVFPEADKTSLHNTVPLLKDILSDADIKVLQDKLTHIPTHDEAMAEAIKKAKVVLGFSFIERFNETKPILKSGISISGASPEKSILNFEGAVKNLDIFEQAAAGNGSFNITPEIDSIVRRLPLVFYEKGNYYPSLVLESLRIAQGASSVIIKTQKNTDDAAIVETIRVGNKVIPTDQAGNLLIYYTKDIPQRTIPAWQVLENKVEGNNLSGSIVLIGTSAAGLKDQRPTPLNPFAPGIEIQTNAVEQILTDSYLYRPDWLMGLEITIMTVVGLFLIRLMSRFGSIYGLFITIIFTSIVISVSWYAFKHYHWLIDPVYPAITISVLYFVVLLLNYFKSENERKYVRNAFSHYISPALVEKLVQNTEALKLGGEMRDMSVLFCDIRGFTSISEQLDAGALTHFINDFLTSMTQVILDKKGTIDKYIGDCIMALWNAPLEDNDHAMNACMAALTMLESLVLFNQRQKRMAQQENRPFIEVQMGIGINTGICCVGNMGSATRFDYSVLGDNVNLSSRLEGQSKLYGVSIIISEYTLASMQERGQAQQFAILELDVIRVKGKSQPVRIYTVLGAATLASSNDFIGLVAVHSDMMRNYYSQNWQDVLVLLARCRAFNRPDMRDFYRIYQQRVESFIVTPPDSSWDGVYIATAK